MAEKLIFISSDTSFKGAMIASEVVVEGSVEGEIVAMEKVLLKKGAKVTGTIQTQKLLIEEGGIHDGFIQLARKSELSALKTSAIPEGERSLAEQPEEKEPVANSGVKENNTSQRLW